MADEEDQAEVLPGFTVHGMDIGKWLARQRKPEVWETLTDGRAARAPGAARHRPLAHEPEEPAKPSTAHLSAFERGVAALGAQYKARTGSVKVFRAHVERLEDGTEVKLVTSGWSGQ